MHLELALRAGKLDLVRERVGADYVPAGIASRDQELTEPTADVDQLARRPDHLVEQLEAP